MKYASIRIKESTRKKLDTLHLAHGQINRLCSAWIEEGIERVKKNSVLEVWKE